MKITKRLIAMLLVLVLLVGMYPVAAQAEENQVTLENGNTTIESTNGFGHLLSQALQEEQEVQEEDYSGGYNVVGLTIEGNIATVEYASLEEAVLVVALYSEDGMKLLLSGNTLVDPEGTEAIVEFDGELPEYFMASAYLLDTFDYSPLCSSYDTPMYTREMQDLLASTVEDYDADKVLNLDDSKETNFAVFAEDTKVLEYTEGVNTIISANNDTLTYIIGNADENITGLQAGDVLAYVYGEDEILIVKVAIITANGSTVTLTGSELDMEDVFSHVKMENMGNAGDVVVDESTAGDGIVFEGISTDGSQTYGSRGVEDDPNREEYLYFYIDTTFTDESDPKKEASLCGRIGLSLDITTSFYVTMSHQFVEFKVDFGVKAEVALSGSVALIDLPIPELAFKFYGISIGLDPSLKVKFSGEIKYTCFFGSTIGFSYDSTTGWHNLTTAPRTEHEVNFEGSIFFGIDLNPTVKILEGVIAEFELEAPIGLELNASLNAETSTNAESKHTCIGCIYCELYFKAEFNAKMQFLKCKYLQLEKNLKVVKVKLRDCYFSIDHLEFGWGTCPYQEYHVIVHVENTDNQNVANTEIYAYWKEEAIEIPLGKTNSNGIVENYLPLGKYTFSATIDGELFLVEVEIKNACKVIWHNANSPYRAYVEPDKITDHGIAIDSGTCGDDLYWTLYSSGLMEIWGTGKMYDYWWGTGPWSSYRSINSIHIKDGVTSIGACAFYGFGSLTSITIPDSVTSIGDYAFCGCSGLTNIALPNSITRINDDVFIGCTGLTSITIPDSVTRIGWEAFSGCTSLSSITIPDSVTYVDDSAFAYCNNLTSITIPHSVTRIGAGVFTGCNNLISLQVEEGNPVYHSAGNCLIQTDSKTLLVACNTNQIPADGTVAKIADSVFYDHDDLISITIPDSVTYIGEYAFGDCDNLTSITIPDSVTRISDSLFYSCDNLASITIGNNVTSIGSRAFSGCSSLTSFTIPASVTYIGSEAFSVCSSLTSLQVAKENSVYHSAGNCLIETDSKTLIASCKASQIPTDGSVTSIGYKAFCYCTDLTRITIPDCITSISNYAFYGCKNLKTICFEGNRPNIDDLAFYSVDATAYYPAGNTTWTSSDLSDFDGKIVWISYNGEIDWISLDEADDAFAMDIENNEGNAEESGGISTYGLWGGEYETETVNGHTLKTATFSGLVPGEEYVLLSLVSIEGEDWLAPENLLYIAQDVAGEDGSLVFTYIQRQDTNISYVIACGATYNNLKDAQITFPEMAASKEIQAVDPTVVFDGKTLVEGVDYTIVGTTAYNAPGTYTCYIRGIYNYSGTVKCTYTVGGFFGDIDRNGSVDCNDAIYLLLHIMFSEENYPLNGADADFDGSGVVDHDDAVYLLLHTLFGEMFYPLKG